ncbi:EAL domain-containing protein [Rhodopseudomonas sp. B29]|uniref:EAL domain-containing protein n=1 Tax=Rhodopseudomonas sp. B29 TaxID=95607 RepID=UPI0003464192|nr:EAL domain-containing response regulator [Rhodopseudomonas sp. B29]
MKSTIADSEDHAPAVGFGRRRLAPRALVIDRKPHLRAFMIEALEELRFVSNECENVSDLPARLAEHRPELVVLGSSLDGIEAALVIGLLAESDYHGNLLVLCARESIASQALQQLGHDHGLNMLPPLATPFNTPRLLQSLSPLLPREPLPEPEVDVAEALKAGWLELWYQPKVEVRSLMPVGAEALVRMRHPNWGVVSPSAFLPGEDDPHLRALSDYVAQRALDDWAYLLEHHGPVDLSINLPASFLRDPASIAGLVGRIPSHPAFPGLIVEIDARELTDLSGLNQVARRLQLRNIGLCADHVGVEWPALMQLSPCPFVEFKVDPTLVAGCAEDRLKRTVCRRIVELAGDYGARAVATGIETRADYHAVHELGFDHAQGFLFGKPMPLKKFARMASSRPLRLAE